MPIEPSDDQQLSASQRPELDYSSNGLPYSESDSTIHLMDRGMLSDGIGFNVNEGLHQGIGLKQFLQEEERRRALLKPKLQQPPPPSSYHFNSTKAKLSLSPPRRESSSSSSGGGGGGSSSSFHQVSTPVEETFSPAMSDSTSTDTDGSVGETEPLHPLTPITSTGFNHTTTSSTASPSSWTPRELNLVRKKSSFQNLSSSTVLSSSPSITTASKSDSEERGKKILKDKAAEIEKEKEREKSRLGSERVPLAVGLGISASKKADGMNDSGKAQIRSGGKKELRLLVNTSPRVESPIQGDSHSPSASMGVRSPSPFTNANTFTYGRSSPQPSPRSPLPINPSRPTFATSNSFGHRGNDSNNSDANSHPNSNSTSSGSESRSTDRNKPITYSSSTSPTERRKRSSLSHSRKRSSTSFNSKSMGGEGQHLGKIPSPFQSPHDPMPSPSGSVASASSSGGSHHQSSSLSDKAKKSQTFNSSPKVATGPLPSPGGFSESRKKSKKAIPKLPPMPLVLDSKSGPTFTLSSEQSPSSAGHASARARGEDLSSPSIKTRSSSRKVPSSSTIAPGGGGGASTLNPSSALQPPFQDDYHAFLATSPSPSHLKSSPASRYSASMKSERHLSAASFVSAVSIPTSGFHTPTYNPNPNNDSSDSNATFNGISSSQNASLGSQLSQGAGKVVDAEPPQTAFFDFEEAEEGNEDETRKQATVEKMQRKEEEENRIPLLFRIGSARPTLEVEKAEEISLIETAKGARSGEKERRNQVSGEAEEDDRELVAESNASSVAETTPEKSSLDSTLRLSSTSGSSSSSPQSCHQHSAFEFESSPPPLSAQNPSIDHQLKSEASVQPPKIPSSSSVSSALMNLPPPLIRTTSATSDPSSEYSVESASAAGPERSSADQEDREDLDGDETKREEENHAEAIEQALEIVGQKKQEQTEELRFLSSSPEEMRPSIPTSASSLPQPIPGTVPKGEIFFRTSIFGGPPISASPESAPIDPRSREGSLTTTLPQISIHSTSPSAAEASFPSRASLSRSKERSSDASSSNSSRNNSSSNSNRAGTAGSMTSAATSFSNHGLKISVNTSGFNTQVPLSPGMPSPHYRSTPLSQREFASNKGSPNEMAPPIGHRSQPSRSNSTNVLETGNGLKSQSPVVNSSSSPIRAALMSPEAQQPHSGLSSRWSSGSESEGEATTSAGRRRRSSSVSGKKASKDKHLSASSKNQGASSSASSTKAFFSGLNLRKKSLPFGSDASASGSSAPGSWAGTPLTGVLSPTTGGHDGSNGEWPFPVTLSPNVTSVPSQSRASNESQRPPSQVTRGRSGSLADRFSQMTQSKARANSLKSKASDVSLNSSLVSHNQDSNLIPSIPNTASTSQHAASPSSSQPNRIHETQRTLAGLGISDLTSPADSTLPKEAGSKSSGDRERTISSPTDAPLRPPRLDDVVFAGPPSGLRAARALHAKQQQQQRQSALPKDVRRSITVNDLQRPVGLSRDSKASLSDEMESSPAAGSEGQRQELKDRARIRESMQANNAFAPSDQTPRVRYNLSLSDSPTSPNVPDIPSRFLSPEDQDGLTEVGRSMFSGIWADLAHNGPDTPSSEKHQSDLSFTDAANGLLPDQPEPVKLTPRRAAKARKAAQINKYQNKVQHRTSLTNLGKSWIEENDVSEFEEMIVKTATSGPSGERASIGQSDDSSSEGGTDYYGSSDGRGGGRSNDEQSGNGSGNGSGAGGSGGSGGQDNWNQDNGRDSVALEEEEDTETEESESDSDEIYGTPDPLLSSRPQSRKPPAPSNLSVTSRPGNETDSSDDVPLGERVSDAAGLQKNLRDRERKEQISKAVSALERGSKDGDRRRPPSHRHHAKYAARTKADVNGGYKLDAADLTARLLRVQARMNGQGEISTHSGSSRGIPSRGKRNQVAPPVQTAAVSPTAQQGSLSRARSLNNGSRARSGTAAAAPPPLPTTGLGMMPNFGGLPLSPPLPQMPGFIPQAAPNPASLQQSLPAPQRSATLPHSSTQVSSLPGLLTSPTVGHAAAARSGSSLPQTSTRMQATALTLDASAVVRHNGLPASPALHDLSSKFEDASLQQQPQQRSRSRSVSRARQIAPINANIAPPMPELTQPHLVSSPPNGSSSGSLASPNNSGLPSVGSLVSAVQTEDQPLSAGESTLRRSSSNRRPEFSSLSPIAKISNTQGTQGSQGSSQSHSPLGPPSQRIQHRVYVVTKQRYGTAEVTTGARARDLVLDIMDKEYIPQDGKGGGWVVFDVCPELGLERPIREYELISEISELRATPEDYFLLKRTELAPYLSIRSVPSVSPTLAGWVYVQESKGKWTKRWLELRDHQLFHAKNEKGKNEVLICHLSGFDAYLVDVQKIKAPKAHGFALRSQHSITMFEKPDQDYVHYFSLSDPNAHRSWVRACMNARTYILKQEHAALFKPPENLLKSRAEALSREEKDSTSSDSSAVASGRTSSEMPPRNLSSRRVVSPPSSSDQMTSILQQQQQQQQQQFLSQQQAFSNLSSSSRSQPPQTLISRDAFAGPFEKGSLLAEQAMKTAPLSAMRTANPSSSNDFSTHQRTRDRQVEEQRRIDLRERSQRARAEGTPLAELAGRRF